MENKSKLDALKEQCLMVVNFFIQKNGADIQYNMFKEVIIESAAANNIRGLRHLSRDIKEWVKGLSDSDLSEVKKMLHDTFGKESILETTKTQRGIKEIIAANKIDNDKEYRIALEYVEQKFDDSYCFAEIEKLNILLAAYHIHKK